jgi:hypothetical protein
LQAAVFFFIPGASWMMGCLILPMAAVDYANWRALFWDLLRNASCPTGDYYFSRRDALGERAATISCGTTRLPFSSHRLRINEVVKTSPFPFLRRASAVFILLCLTYLAFRAETPSSETETPKLQLIKPAEPTGTGLLLQPPLDLSKFSKEEFTRLSSSVGEEKINKKWTNAVVTLPERPRANPNGLTEQEVKEYMAEVRRLFDEGKAIPVSDAGLISTQEDVIRRPMLNHISAFSNSVARVYLLVQKTSTDKGWGYFSIVQDLTLDPPLDYFGDLNGKAPRFEGISCYKCHSSGPLAIHPTRGDLVNDPLLAAAISKHIAKQPLSRFYFPPNEKKPEYGNPLALEFCSECHEADGKRLPLFKVHSHPMRVLVDFGYMPPKRRLTPEEVAQLKSWLESKP